MIGVSILLGNERLPENEDDETASENGISCSTLLLKTNYTVKLHVSSPRKNSCTKGKLDSTGMDYNIPPLNYVWN